MSSGRSSSAYRCRPAANAMSSRRTSASVARRGTGTSGRSTSHASHHALESGTVIRRGGRTRPRAASSGAAEHVWWYTPDERTDRPALAVVAGPRAPRCSRWAPRSRHTRSFLAAIAPLGLPPLRAAVLTPLALGPRVRRRGARRADHRAPRDGRGARAPGVARLERRGARRPRRGRHRDRVLPRHDHGSRSPTAATSTSCCRRSCSTTTWSSTSAASASRSTTSAATTRPTRASSTWSRTA